VSLENNVSHYSTPSDLKITDLRAGADRAAGRDAVHGACLVAQADGLARRISMYVVGLHVPTMLPQWTDE
jgi:hypothetical protein